MGKGVTIGTHNTIGGAGFAMLKMSLVHIVNLRILNVVLEDNVTIHNNTCIDRAVIGSTVISKVRRLITWCTLRMALSLENRH